jgi:uncharacterized membrane protein required for colicin V production
MHAKDLASIPMPNFFDAIVVAVLIWGLNKGRKHGMSEELMMTMQWIVIIFAGAFLYRPFGDMMAMSAPVGHLFCYITIYVTAAIITKIVFGLFKKAVGGKLVGSDVFGGAEYYLGMISGAIRYTCMLIAAMAILNAPYYSSQDISASQAYDNKWYGSDFFPRMYQVQQTVFKDSLIGSLIKQRAGVLLITSTKVEKVGIARRKDDLP